MPRRLTGLDGLVLAGGTDIDAALYGAPRHAETGDPDCDRDRVEVALLQEALERDLPVLAICRGMQMLNVALGGTLAQHIEGHLCPGQAVAHGLSIAPGSRLDGILGTAVNSRHHQCVERLADGLVVVGRAPDDVVEAVELPWEALRGWRAVASGGSGGGLEVVCGVPGGYGYARLFQSSGVMWAWLADRNLGFLWRDDPVTSSDVCRYYDHRYPSPILFRASAAWEDLIEHHVKRVIEFSGAPG